MYKTPTAARHAAFVSQSHRCFYCAAPIWETSEAEFARTHRVTSRQARLLKCTAEHLHPRNDGGSNARANVVAACRFCNGTRHKAATPLDPEAYRKRVLSLVSKGRWLPSKLARLSSPSA
jgi:5-methylcytosine-specific restriction endonuclease McrA